MTMRKALTAVLSVAAIALPQANAWAATSKKSAVVTRKFTGSAVAADRWGYVQVTITVRKTTTTVNGKRRVTRRMTNLTATAPTHTARSVVISEQAIPILRSEALRAQSAKIQLVSGATDVSQAFAESLQSAIVKALAA
jgi:uncharacterized protein with FMN-binding domain